MNVKNFVSKTVTAEVMMLNYSRGNSFICFKKIYECGKELSEFLKFLNSWKLGIKNSWRFFRELKNVNFLNESLFIPSKTKQGIFFEENF